MARPFATGAVVGPEGTVGAWMLLMVSIVAQSDACCNQCRICGVEFSGLEVDGGIIWNVPRSASSS